MTFGSIEPLSDHLPFPVIDIQNQGAKASTRMACGQFALAHVINAQNRIRAAADKTDYIPRDASREWSRLAQKNSTILTEGTTLQSNLADAVSHEAVTGYAVVQTREEIEHALAHQRYIYTGSASGDWKAVRDTKRYKVRRDGKFVGHIIAVGSYTDE
ncbi:MAG TPA: hypothetical protein PK765_03375 [bacterium]|nr:hypothetical protein [bacterium]